ncbi:MAG: hypothetical protein LOY58_02415 [Gammaproteobacteria bacterium]|nr:hypothetical protein [Gammaproteobacteria bacterium]
MDLTRLTPAARRKLSLELSMRDVLDGLEELVSLDVYRFEPGCFEILSIERPIPESPTVPAHPSSAPAAQLLRFPDVRTPRKRAQGG